ncbi:MAG: ATP-binding protein [Treponemataceae bacterium]|nr:ATP-binding protein [Treponemataceae bacterium]
MGSGFSLFVNIAPAAIVVLIVAFVTVFPYRKEPAGQALLWYIGLCIWLLATNILELIAPPGSQTILFAKLQYVAFLYIPIAWMSFSLRYTGWVTQSKPSLILLAIIGPVLGVLVVATNEYHGLLWKKIFFFESEGFSVLRPEYGPFYWIIFMYSWLAIAGGCVIILRSYIKGEKLYYRQSLWIILGTLLPAIANIFRLTNKIHGIVKDFTPLGFALSAVFFLIGMYFHRLFWVMPVSRGVLLEEIDVGVVVLDTLGRIVDHNKSGDQLLHLEDVAVGKPYTMYPLLSEVLNTIGGYTSLKSFPSCERSGKVFCNGKTLKYTLQSSGMPLNGTVLMVEDISKEVALQTENSVIKSEYLKKEKLASLGQIAAGLIHEINNPIAYMKSDVRSLFDLLTNLSLTYSIDATDKNFQNIKDIVTGMYEGLSRIEDTTRSLLNFARNNPLEEDSQEEVLLHDCIETTLKIMKNEYQQTTDIIRHYGDIPPLRLYRRAINQVLFNLLANAVEAINVTFNETGIRGTIEISTGVSEGMVWCEILDTGKPIEQEHAQHIFDLFFTTKSPGWGTGIGLALCKEIVETKHKGKLSLVSLNPVIFRMELPLQAVLLRE